LLLSAAARPGPAEIAGDDLLEHRAVRLAHQPQDHADPIADPDDAALVDGRARDPAAVHVGPVHAVQVGDDDHRGFLQDFSVLPRHLVTHQAHVAGEIATQHRPPGSERGDAALDLGMHPDDRELLAVAAERFGAVSTLSRLLDHSIDRR
jgi:hypothetical protein